MSEDNYILFEKYEILIRGDLMIATIKDSGDEKRFIQRIYCHLQDSVTQNQEWLKENFEILKLRHHPSLVPLHQYHIIGNEIYIIWDYVVGRFLDDIIIKTKKLPLVKVIQWGIEICDALEGFHHLTPSYIVELVRPFDIVINSKGEAKLWNYGLELKLTSRLRPNPMYVDLAIGNYFAAEHYKGKLSPQVDIYCLGATLHHLVTYKHPYNYSFVRNEEKPQYLAQLLNDVDTPEEISRIILKATAFKPEDRYTSAAEMKADLEALPTDILDISVPKLQQAVENLFSP